MAGYNSNIDSGSASAEETSSSEIHLVTCNIADVSMWDSWSTRAASDSGHHDELATANSSSSTAEEQLGDCSNPRGLSLQCQPDNNMLSGWLSSFNSMSQTTGLDSLQLCEQSGPDHLSVPDPPTAAAGPLIRSEYYGQLQQPGSAALMCCNSSLIDYDDPAADQSSDDAVQALELADLYIRTAAGGLKNVLHADQSPAYYSYVSTPNCVVSCDDQELSSESYSTSFCREETFAYGTAQTALQLLQSLDSDQSPSSPDRPIYNNTPTQLPFVGSWDGSNYVVPVSTWVSNCPQASSQVLAGGGTNLRQLMHADHYSCVNQFSAAELLQAAERDQLFPASFTASGDPGYYATYNHPSKAMIRSSEHPKVASGTIDRQNFDTLMNRSSVVTWPNYCTNAEIFTEMLGNNFNGDDLHSTREDRVSSVSTNPVSSTIPTSCSTVGVVELAELQHLNKDRPGGKHRLELVGIDSACEDETSPPRLKRKGNVRVCFFQSNLKYGVTPDPKPKTFESHTSSSSCSSLQLEVMDMIAVGPALNTNGKPRARRGSATDPQSIYARHRRNKINERLKTLQHLVPNGAKVDIVTMLEEAIDYVKYLQNQVKLLKMEQWMSGTPTIYNGVDISAI
ncbi:unnamed protein product [Sphagnum jensenii]|uniref:BHLH domain-containing protein n=1 Tax=Sphagnum jensenii TaxID=128206 RepID=A0ABP0W0M2_9BRYO